MNKLSMFFAAAIAGIKATGVVQPSPNGSRIKKFKRRGYYVNGERVYYRPAAPWVPNIAGTRISMGRRVDRTS